MADYAASVTSPLGSAERVSRNIGIYTGKFNLSNYNVTLIKQTSITKWFKVSGVSGFTQGIISVVPSGVSDNGHTFEWDYTTGAFKAYKPSNVAATTLGVLMDSDVSSAGIAVVYGSGDNKLHATSGVGNLDVVQAAAANVAIEAANDVDCGEVGFVAIGLI